MPTTGKLQKLLRMAGVERAWYPIQNLRQGTPLPAFLNFGVWPGQKRPGPEIFIRFSTHPWTRPLVFGGFARTGQSMSQPCPRTCPYRIRTCPRKNVPIRVVSTVLRVIRAKFQLNSSRFTLQTLNFRFDSAGRAQSRIGGRRPSRSQVGMFDCIVACGPAVPAVGPHATMQSPSMQPKQ